MNVVLGITGSIAAYKSAQLVRELVRGGHAVRVLMTPAATDFISPLTLATLSRHDVITSVRGAAGWNNHVELGLWADAMIIAPATANTLARLAHGICDSIVVAVYLSARCPVWFAPAMDLDMWAHPSTRANVARLQSYGNHLIEPGEGELASGLKGKGRMAEPEDIVAAVTGEGAGPQELGSGWAGRRVLVTAGPTYEDLDPVRYLGNRSTGRMGIALARAAAARGATVELVLGPTALGATGAGITVHAVRSAREMYARATELWPACDVGILTAAVADYRPARMAEQKIKKSDGELHLELVRNPDIAAELGRRKTEGQLLAGFALETEDGLANARAKLTRKKLDLIVLNSPHEAGAGFAHTTNRVDLIDHNKVTPLELKTKDAVAADILDALAEKLPPPMKHALTLLLILFFCSRVPAQGPINFTVNINTQQITQADPRIFKTLEKDLALYLNNTPWTADRFAEDERIEASIFLTVREVEEETNTGADIVPNAYAATLAIQSSRPVYGTSQATPVFNYQDKRISFNYQQFEAIQYSEQSFTGNLATIMAFYAYLILGFDYDTFSPLGGQEYFEEAQELYNRLPTNVTADDGWKAEGKTRNRYFLMENVLQPRMLPLRRAYYNYHRLGLDLMHRDPTAARANITLAIEDAQAANQAYLGSVYAQAFVDAKREEIIAIYRGAPGVEQNAVITAMSRMDPSQSSEYRSIRNSGAGRGRRTTANRRTPARPNPLLGRQ